MIVMGMKNDTPGLEAISALGVRVENS
jgi:hypothetical protein